ncbi:extracellular solute-binding protein [soil metagenome]
MQCKRYSRRNFLKATGVTGLSLTLAACAPVNAPATTGSGAATEGTAEKLTITIWGWWEERMKIFQQAGDDFTAKNPNITVKVETFGDELWPKVYASVPAGTGPTLCKMQTTNFFKMRDQGLLVELANDMFPNTSLREKYPDHAWDAYGFYCIPEGIQSAVFTYNKKLFTEAQLDPEKPPRTWDEFFDAAQKLTKRDSQGTITQAGFQYDDWMPILNPLYQLGGNLIKRDGDKLTADFSNTTVEKSFQFFVDLAQKYKAWDINLPYVSDAIGNQQAAMSIGEAWVHGTYKSDFPDTFKDLGFAAPPTPSGDANPYYGRKNAVLNLAAIKNRPDAESKAGLKFLEYLITERLDTQYALAEISGLVPARAELMTGDQVKADSFLTLGGQLAPKEYDAIEVSDALNKLIGDALHKVIVENQPLAAVLEAGQSELQKLIDAKEVKHLY